MRGAPVESDKVWCIGRIIPADAGSTVQIVHACDGFEDHPRGCGEHISYESQPRPGTGSSPRMRGARSSSVMGLYENRIVPADAGSTG